MTDEAIQDHGRAIWKRNTRRLAVALFIVDLVVALYSLFSCSFMRIQNRFTVIFGRHGIQAGRVELANRVRDEGWLEIETPADADSDAAH